MIAKDIFSVVFEDNHLLIVNKAAGILVQDDKTGDKTLLEYGKDYLKEKYGKPGNVFLGMVHRIDRPVSGLVIFAKTSKALDRVNKMFRDREIHKTYWAVVNKQPYKPEAQLIHWLKKDMAKNYTTAYSEQISQSWRAELSYKILSSWSEYFLLQVNPVTGRPHQIRVQLSKIGCSIKGDLKYGYPTPNSDASINLHARQLNFLHPVKKEPLEVVADLPQTEPWLSLSKLTATAQ